MIMFSEQTDSVPGAVRQLVALFEQDLAAVEFPGVGLASLGAHIEALEESAGVVHEAEAKLTAARDTLAERRRALSRHAEQAVAYLRVFAAERPELQERVSALELVRATSSPPPERKRGRPRKTASPPAIEPERGPSELPLGPEVVATPSEPAPRRPRAIPGPAANAPARDRHG